MVPIFKKRTRLIGKNIIDIYDRSTPHQLSNMGLVSYKMFSPGVNQVFGVDQHLGGAPKYW